MNATTVTNNTTALNQSADVSGNQLNNAGAPGDASIDNIEEHGVFMIDEIFDEEKIMSSTIFQQQAKLLEDPRLEGDEMHRKLVTRLTAFYLNQQKIRINGLTEQQKATIKKTGYSLEYRVQLHKSLRTKLLQIVSEHDHDMK